MRYVSFLSAAGKSEYGRLDGEVIHTLSGPDRPPDLKSALEAGALSQLADGKTLALPDVTLLPVIPNPGKILCVGLNYANHVAEMGRQQSGYPAIFTRWPDTLAAHGEGLVRPLESTAFDFEGELAVVIGRACRRVTIETAMDHVAGFSVFHDASVRDWQRHTIQFTPGKNFPKTGGFGPALVSLDEVPELGELRVQTRLNGELVQDQPISDMIFSVPEIVSYCSTFTQLNPGDVIATGTPGGVGDKRVPPLYMKGGDRVEVSIGAIGVLGNRIVDEA